MGRKGFTLVELIAVVFIISIVLGIASFSVIGLINNSKKKSEELFVQEIDLAISQYVGLYGSKLVKGTTSYTFNKCRNSSCSISEVVSAAEIFNGSVGNYVKLSSLVDEDFFDTVKLINPVNKKDCLDGRDPVIRFFKDSDYVYYYYVDLSGNNTSCDISSDNGIIDTLPSNLKVEVGI